MKYFPEEPYTEAATGPTTRSRGRERPTSCAPARGRATCLFGQVAFQLMTGAESNGAAWG